ncbi:unnamed protein product [Adineta steineri]|uniref:NAD(P)(+)--arginine ADP-ribosyltransferase n=1 Tax=Adineta steineri TaxID=433720 RepID=A0A815L7N5_9BILA|nr:unnamed protein product [Adineta steineri]CAF4133458.1 unnamed protein product [Adineta steineri]
MIPSNAIQPRRHIPQNYSLVWLDECMEESTKDYQNILTQLKTISGNVDVFKRRDLCIDYLTDTQEDIKTFLVVKDTVCQQIMSLINNIPQLHGIYIFNDTNILNEESIKKWQKIKSVHTNIDDLCQELQSGIKQYHQDSIAVSFIPVDDMTSANDLNQLEPTFMYTQIFKEILLDMKHDEQAIKDFITYCRDHDCVSTKYIDRFEKEYSSQLAIWWYTFPSNICSMLNYGLRTMEGDTIINMGFFIHDLHQQILQLHQQQVNSYHGKSFTVYRGQGLSKPNFEKLQKTKGGLMSFNNFLSTSTEEYIPLGLACSASENADMVGILFIMSVDPNVKSALFASIKELSYFKEEYEILFSMHTVFRVGTTKQLNNNNRLYQVELQLTSDDDPQLRLLTGRIREEASGSRWQRLGDLLLTIGQFNKAEELYNELLEHTYEVTEKAIYYQKLGHVHFNQGDYDKAIWYYEKSLHIREKTLPSNHSDLAILYNNIGGVYDSMGEYSKALSFYEKAREFLQETLPSHYPYLAASYNNIGSVYTNMGEYSKALSSHEKALEILQTTLPLNHPNLATSYISIGSAHHHMGEYSRALSYHEKAFHIQQKTLPSNHPDLATSNNHIGLVYDKMGEYSKALSFHEKALEIYQNTLPSNHSLLATSYVNIGCAYHNMGVYSKALSFYEKALEVCEKTLPSNHHLWATSNNNIGGVYHHMGEYSKALSYHEKALKFLQETLPSNHPHLANSYDSIGCAYHNMGELSKALSYHEKAFQIREKTLSSNHPDLATSYNNIGMVYNHMEEYSKALSFHEKALEILQKTLPSDHPHLATSYDSIGCAYHNMGELSKALSYHEKAFQIREKTLPSNHPSLATLYMNLSSVYRNMGERSKALSFHEKALEIYQNTLPSNRSLLATL